MSVPPNRSSPSCTAAATWAESVTSSATGRAFSGYVRARSRTESALRAVTTALCPASRTARARSRPSPLELPVMSQVDMVLLDLGCEHRRPQHQRRHPERPDAAELLDQGPAAAGGATIEARTSTSGVALIWMRPRTG